MRSNSSDSGNTASEKGLRKRFSEPLNRVTVRLFLAILILYFFLAGANVGMIIGMMMAGWNTIVMILVLVAYWLAAAGYLTWYIRRLIRKSYEQPARRISEAAKEIARGDFAVRIEEMHENPEEQDFFDETIRDVNRMAEELGSIETLKTDFASNVSHEMKTPLAVIKNSAELLQKGMPSEDPKREYVDAICDNAGKMADLITNILRLNRIENQKIAVEMREYDLILQLSECVLQFEPVWEKKQIEPDIEMEDSCMIRADESLLALVWNNLLSNAFKFTEEGGTVRVQQRSEGDQVIVSVQDTGCGMSEETVNRIFEKFYQGDTSHATEGNGLGLALAGRVISLLGGEIEVESEPGAGSTFTVRLPRI